MITGSIWRTWALVHTFEEHRTWTETVNSDSQRPKGWNNSFHIVMHHLHHSSKKLQKKKIRQNLSLLVWREKSIFSVLIGQFCPPHHSIDTSVRVCWSCSLSHTLQVTFWYLNSEGSPDDKCSLPWGRSSVRITNFLILWPLSSLLQSIFCN